MVGAGLGGDTARQDGEGSRPHGSDRLLIKPAAMVTRPVPAVRGHFERKARPATAGYEGATRAASTSLHAPAPGEQPACLPSDGRLRSEPLALPTPTRSGAQAGTAGSITVTNRRSTSATTSPIYATPAARRMAGAVPAHPAVVQDWWRDGGHRRSVAAPNSACHRPPSRSLLAQLVLRTALQAGRLGRDPGRGHGSTSPVVSAGWCPRVRLRPRGRRGGPT